MTPNLPNSPSTININEIEREPFLITPSDLAKAIGVKQAAISKWFSSYDLPMITGKSIGIPPALVRKYLVNRGYQYSKQVIAHVNMRGGIGKTTSTISGASRAAQYGYNTVIIDLDSQGSASQTFDLEPEENDDIFIDVWNANNTKITKSLKKIQSNLYLMPSSLENGLLDSQLNNPKYQKTAVNKVCSSILDEISIDNNEFDLIFIDCPPSLGSAIISTICAADVIVIPVQSDAFSIKGLELTIQEIKSICTTFNIKLPDIKILYTNYDGRKKQSMVTLQKLVKEYGENMIPTFIRSSTEFDKAIEKKETVFSSPRQSSAKEDYDMYVRYLFEIGSDEKSK